MKFIIEAYGNKYSIETESDGQNLEEMCQLFKQLLLSAGYVFSGEVVIEDEKDND